MRGLGRSPQRRSSATIDKSHLIAYLRIMLNLARILVAALLAVFAAGSVVHATSATTMAVKMALADGATLDMSDCMGCDAEGSGDEGGQTCDLVCTAPFVADLGAGSTTGLPAAVSTVEPKSVYDFVGRTGPPDLHPPRSFI